MNILQRLQKLQAQLKTALLVEKSTDLLYLTGLQLSAGKLLVNPKEALLLVDGRYIETAQQGPVAAALIEDVANLARGTVQIVRNDLDDHRNAARRVSLVGDLLVVRGLAFAGSLLNRALNIIVRHIRRLRLRDNVLQFAVLRRICAAASLDRDYNFATDLGKDLAFRSVGLCLLIFNG